MIVKTQHNIKQLIKKYRAKDNTPIVFDFKKASKDLWDNKCDKDNRYINYIHYYPGRIYPYIPLYVLSLNDFSHLNGYLLDPFAGSGTILLESIINPVFKRNAIGVEINPLARLISKVKLTPIDLATVPQLMKKLHILYLRKADTSNYIPTFKNINLWFFNKAIKKLAKLKYAIEKLNVSVDYKDFFWVCFSSIIRKVSKADPYIPPPVLLKPEKYKNNPNKYQKLKNHLNRAEDPEVWNLFETGVNKNLAKLGYLNNFEELRTGKIKAEIIWYDARCIKRGQLSERGRIDINQTKKLPLNSFDIIFTSPPYLTAQKYIRTSKLELLWLGYSEKDINSLDKTSIGTERIPSKARITELSINSIDSLVNRTFSKSKGRGLMVYNYFENMVKVFKEMYCLLRKGGYAIFVVGCNKVLGEKVDTYRLLTDEAISVGFKEILIFKDKIRTRSMMTKRNGTGGIIKNEYIIMLKKE
ncbi:hypothetical protein CH333_05350 [candidate division WOR-3 bacterium JGI_Cruoil_03_44_89]|uniref:site-specific DNA-methyltransferase (cytosine-N(4)-specific) n=1 Tax=candidate division WOR-3 bacterium JGI_Cruoil_03_44_89 TaxID=1973748 RepID=A0A235BTQ1_UNCW3|nr:MAG: hypothetical protein CH333_05350 [candidate division WOR-3 bacterium JGI_Cruoil_03_44_89]